MLNRKISYDVGIVGGGPVGILMSNLLNQFGISHCLIEKRISPSKHPQAHYLNTRSTEIISSSLPHCYNGIVKAMPPSMAWRDFAYSHSVTGTQLGRIDQFANTPIDFWNASPANVIHLAQNKLETLLRAQLIDSSDSYNTVGSKTFFGYEVTECTHTSSGSQIQLRNKSAIKDEHNFHCKYLVAADGANSFIRRSLGIPLEGEDSMQSLVNVHFTCKGLRELLTPRSAMLYFVYNEAMVGVFVAHDPQADEWVCQIPFFPPFQSAKDFDESRVLSLLMAGLFAATDEHPAPSPLKIEIRSINSWVMHAQVARAFSNDHGNVFLVGDSAHRFPPAGGFGMNTGLQDAHNLAWKLAWVLQGRASEKLLSSYESERRPVALANTSWSLTNYAKSAAVAATLGVDPQLAKTVVAATLKLPVPFTVQQRVMSAALTTGLYSLRWLRDLGNITGKLRAQALQKMIGENKTLPMVFPREDLGFVYAHGAVATSDVNNSGDYDRVTVGGRAPHVWFTVESSLVMDSFRMSSVELPAVVQTLLSFENKTTNKAHITPPPLLIFVDSEYHTAFTNSLLQSADQSLLASLCLVSVSSEQPSEVSHEYLQQLWQTPRHEQTGPEVAVPESDLWMVWGEHKSLNNSIHSEMVKTDKATEDLLFRSLMCSLVTSESNLRSVRVTDPTGRWRHHCESFNNSDKSTGGGAKRPLQAVCVRPDGHVAAVLSGVSEKEVVSFVESLHKALCLK